MSLEVLQVGADAAWRGAPRFGLRRFGVPQGGPFDLESWARACSLSESSSAIEVGPFGGRFVAIDSCSVVIVGASRDIRVGGRESPCGRLFLPKGGLLEIGPPVRGARSYVAGYGIADPCERVSLEPLFVRRGDRIQALIAPERHLADGLPDGAIRLVAGPQANQFDLDQFTRQEFYVSPVADRTGIRLSERILARESSGERLSEPIVFGAVQVTVGGEPIIIGPDGPTIGGYPVAAVVIAADRDRLGQLKPGDRVRFEFVTLDAARRLRADYRSRLRATLASMAHRVH